MTVEPSDENHEIGSDNLHAKGMRPSPARFYLVARNASSWTEAERRLIDSDPKLRAYEFRMKNVLSAISESAKPTTLVPLQRVRPASQATSTVQAVARTLGEGQSITKFLSSDGTLEVLLFPPSTEGTTAIRFVGKVPMSPVSLLVNRSEVQLLTPMNDSGYCTVRSEEIVAAFSQTAELQLRIDTSAPGVRGSEDELG